VAAGARRFTISNLRGVPAVLSWLPIELRNAVRLHVAGIKTHWTARWEEFTPAPGEGGHLRVSLEFRLTGVGPERLIGFINSDSAARNCGGDDAYSAERRLLARRSRLRVTVRITLAGTARPLANAPLTLRR
jgi:hypothetical protein